MLKFYTERRNSSAVRSLDFGTSRHASSEVHQIQIPGEIKLQIYFTYILIMRVMAWYTLQYCIW